MKWTICFDTICTGYQPVMYGDKPIGFPTEKAATIELEDDPEFYEDCFVCEMSEIGHKTIFHGGER